MITLSKFVSFKAVLSAKVNVLAQIYDFFNISNEKFGNSSD